MLHSYIVNSITFDIHDLNALKPVDVLKAFHLLSVNCKKFFFSKNSLYYVYTTPLNACDFTFFTIEYESSKQFQIVDG